MPFIKHFKFYIKENVHILGSFFCHISFNIDEFLAHTWHSKCTYEQLNWSAGGNNLPPRDAALVNDFFSRIHFTLISFRLTRVICAYLSEWDIGAQGQLIMYAIY